VPRVAYTNLAGMESIAMSHLAQALQYRPKVVEQFQRPVNER
jgi:hypothetical protein